jgi:hypothetical protein
MKVCIQNTFGLRGVERSNVDSGLTEACIQRQVEKVSTIRQELRPSVGQLLPLGVKAPVANRNADARINRLAAAMDLM